MKLLMPLLAAPLLCACMSTENALPRESVADREYPTGSSLPRRASNSGSSSGVSTVDRDAAERARDSQILPQAQPGPARGP